MEGLRLDHRPGDDRALRLTFGSRLGATGIGVLSLPAKFLARPSRRKWWELGKRKEPFRAVTASAKSLKTQREAGRLARYAWWVEEWWEGFARTGLSSGPPAEPTSAVASPIDRGKRVLRPSGVRRRARVAGG
jgi:hypothetical protein